MSQHRFILKPYKGRQSRTYCPQCEQREFSPYIDTTTNELIHPTVGRCNRESNCGYHLTPSEWFKDHPTDSFAHNGTKLHSFAVQPQQPPRPIDTLPMSCVEKSVAKTLTPKGLSDFTRWLALQFDQHTWERLIKDYHLGTADDKGTIFWQVDGNSKVRTGQILHHVISADYRDCKRNHDQHPDWVHSRLMRADKLDKGFNLVQCLFGEHLLSREPDNIVALCEGQKNAIIGSGVCPQWLWVATCGKSGLTAERLQPLKGRKVLVFADLDAHDQWSEKLRSMSLKVGFTYTMFDKMQDIATDEDRRQGLDIADYLLQKFEKQKQ